MYHIRPLRTSDIGSVMEIEETFGKAGQVKEKILNTMNDPTYIGFIIEEENGEALGCALGSKLENYDYFEDPQRGKGSTWYLESIAIKERKKDGTKIRNKGLGKTLYKCALLEAARKGYSRVTDHTFGLDDKKDQKDIGFRKSANVKPISEWEGNWYDDGTGTIYCEKVFNLPEKRFSVDYFTQNVKATS